MKRIGKVLLGIIILILYMGVICFGVMLVIQGTENGALTSVSGLMCGEAIQNQREQFDSMVDEVAQMVKWEMEYEERVAEYVDTLASNMTMEQKLAQMMILTNENDITAANLQTYQPGGIIFFEVDFREKTLETVRSRVDTLQSYMEIPLFVGVDEEGGEVSRLKNLAQEGLPVFKSARTLCQNGMEAVKTDTEVKAQYLKEMGINLNFAPVADVVNEKNSYMYERSASGEATEVSEYVETVLSTMQDNEIMGCMKHFPGYGDNVNTHDGLATDTRSLSEYQTKDFLPFQVGIEAGAGMVMVSHIIMQSVDGENPASLSMAVHDILRDDMDFQGVIIADDLNMQAILKTMSIEEATAKAFVAGNDMIFSANFAASMKGAMKAVEQGTLSEQQVNESVKRVLCMKLENGLLVLDNEDTESNRIGN